MNAFARSLAIAAPLLIAGTNSGAAQQVLTGQILGDSARPLTGAIISVTMAPERTFKQDTSKADGRWRISFERGTGDYLVHIASIGRTAFRKRITVSSADTLVTVDATLASSVQRLATVRVQASRPRPTREDGAVMPDGVSAEHVPTGVLGAVTADLQGDFAALDVKLRRGMVTQPDLLVVPKGELREEEYFVRKLMLAVETVSPSSARSDRVVKRPHYQRSRVPEYWMFDGASQAVERWQPDDERPAIISERLVWQPSGATEAFTLELPGFFRDALDLS